MSYTNAYYTDPRLRGTAARNRAGAAHGPACEAAAYRPSNPRYHTQAARTRMRPLFRPRRSRLTLPCLLVIAALLCGLVAACWFSFTTLSSLAAGAGGQAGAPALQSTPRSEWRAGEVPHLYQGDPAWANTTYAGDRFEKTGCGPTCLAMAYVALTGRDDRTPADVGALSERMGCASPDGTAWLFMTEGAAELGLSARELPADEASVRQALGSGSPVICSVGPGDFTTTGHFIVLAGIDGQGRLIVRDSNSPERTAEAWDFATVLAQCRALWAYSAA